MSTADHARVSRKEKLQAEAPLGPLRMPTRIGPQAGGDGVARPLAGGPGAGWSYRNLDAARDGAPVQRKGAAEAPPSQDVHAAARLGTSGGGGRLPHLGSIQRLFGRHDVSGIVAHTDGAAREGAHAMRAQAFATGHHVAFARTPDLRTAAHEAAHVVQQRAGVQLLGGVGGIGDRYERHADEVAERVVQGRSAEALLDRFAPAAGRATGPSPVQSMAVQRTPVCPHISDDEELAILSYRRNGFQKMNQHLRGQQRHPRVIPTINLLDSALRKMHNSGRYRYNGPVYRGDGFNHYPQQDQNQMDEVGGTIRMASFWSTSKVKKVASGLAGHLWKISTNINGVDLERAKLCQKQESEVLFPRGSVFQVDKARREVGQKTVSGDKMIKITAHQIPGGDEPAPLEEEKVDEEKLDI